MRLMNKSLLLILTLVNAPVIAQIHSLNDIRQTALRYMQTEISKTHPDADISIGQLDPRLRLAQCPAPLSGFLPYTAQAIKSGTVGVRCQGAKPWSIYVPVTVAVYQEIVVASQPLARGKVLSETDIEMQRIDIARLSGNHLIRQESVIGQEVTRPVQMGQPVTSQVIRPPILVKRGQKVPLVAKGGAFEVRMEGLAMADAAIGQRLRVRNIRSKRIVEGKLAKNGTVFVN